MQNCPQREMSYYNKLIDIDHNLSNLKKDSKLPSHYKWSLNVICNQDDGIFVWLDLERLLLLRTTSHSIIFVIIFNIECFFAFIHNSLINCVLDENFNISIELPWWVIFFKTSKRSSTVYKQLPWKFPDLYTHQFSYTSFVTQC